MAIDFTTIVGVDEKHVRELELVWPTWREQRPQLFAQPLLLICDGDFDGGYWKDRLRFVDHPQKQVVLWRQQGVGQREKMLSGLVFAAADQVRTPWYLKLDTDAVSLKACGWIDRRWFDPIDGMEPAIVASPWSYTKPAEWLRTLDEWGDGVEALRNRPRLDLTHPPGAARIRHPRIISWLMFGSTAFLKLAASWCDRRLPAPSQDTFLWYCAARLGTPIRRVRMSRYGWAHGSPRRLLSRLESPQENPKKT